MALQDDFNNRIMADPYSHEEVVDSEIWPLIQQVYERCEELGIPFFATICHTNTGEQHSSNTAIHMCGIERTPMTFPAYHGMQENPDLAGEVIKMLAMKKLRGKQLGDFEA